LIRRRRKALAFLLTRISPAAAVGRRPSYLLARIAARDAVSGVFVAFRSFSPKLQQKNGLNGAIIVKNRLLGAFFGVKQAIIARMQQKMSACPIFLLHSPLFPANCTKKAASSTLFGWF